MSKQGRADHSNVASTKQEPIVHDVDVCAVADIGLETGYGAKQLYSGRGYQAPMVGQTNHAKGSQGKH